jgi:hypothetical protein
MDQIDDIDDIDTYNEYVVKKGIVRFKFIIILFILTMIIFNPYTFDFMKNCMKIKTEINLLMFHSFIFCAIVYIMLVVGNDSYIFSPCNIKLDIEDYLYYENKNVDYSIDIDYGEDESEIIN